MTVVIVLTVFFATILGSISGIGGGVLIKPVMDAISGLSSSVISFLSGTTVLTMTIVSLLRSRNGSVKIDRRGTFLAVGAAVGGYLGKMIFSMMVQSVNEALVGLVQNIIMVILTVAVFFYVKNKAKIRTLNVTGPAGCISSGLFMGILSSFLGIGGGPINIMILSYFFSMDTKTAALNSLYVIFFSQMVSLVSNIISRDIPPFEWPLLLMMMATAVIGATLGRKLSNKMDEHKVDVLFMGLLILITAISVYNCFKFGFLI